MDKEKPETAIVVYQSPSEKILIILGKIGGNPKPFGYNVGEGIGSFTAGVDANKN